MKYNTRDRKIIKTLSAKERFRFNIFESLEQEELNTVSELCSVLKSSEKINLVAFSCLSIGGARKQFDQSLGAFFTKRKIKKTQEIMHLFQNNGCKIELTVILDDIEPKRIWNWPEPQNEITEWSELVVCDVRDQIPGWNIKLWSSMETASGLMYGQILSAVSISDNELLIHQLGQEIERFPSVKTIGNVRTASIRIIAQYAIQGVILEKELPQAILFQTETPYKVKDPLYNPLRQNPLPIIHPFERR